MNYNTIAYQIDQKILTITLKRPDALNAFTIEMAHELIDAINRASKDDDVGAVVVTGEGRAFCAGMDLSAEGNVFGLDETQLPTLEDMSHRIDDPVIRDGVRDAGGKVTLAIFDCNKPVIAAINGAAVGVGAIATSGAPPDAHWVRRITPCRTWRMMASRYSTTMASTKPTSVALPWAA